MQPTPFCNIDCRYCYLPDRARRGRMAFAVLERALARIAESGWLGDRLDIAWHAGEPLVLPLDYYAAALDLCDAALGGSTTVRHGFQTNAILLDRAWCRFLLDRGISLGVSLDGPARFHDSRRVTRSGAGTHARVMRGVRLLQDHGVPFHVICVTNAEALECPDELIDFFLAHNIFRVGFNIEELDGVNRTSSTLDAERAYRRFMARVLERVRQSGGALRVRELESMRDALTDPGFGRYADNDQNRPFAILSIDWQGGIATFSPELLGTSHARYGELTFGNVATHALADIGAEPRFRTVAEAIAAGVRACAERCAYFPVCLGGAPANKLGELDDLAGTETMHCRLTQQALLDAVLDDLERYGTTPARVATAGAVRS
ncbi:MAG: cyclophane-forming radical SAM/SPASM peptide maturase GrrM/OscB [Geminicoccaceae bacterium]